MEKVKLAICIGDEIYQQRFVKCLMNHYREQYELHVFGTLSELIRENNRQYGGFILGECNLEEIGWDEERKEKTLILSEENKYQEVFKIVEALEIQLGNKKLEGRQPKEFQKKVFGIYSLTIPHVQIPFGAVLASILGEQEKTILIDLQTNSGLNMLQEEAGLQLGMEDLMAIATSGSYTKGRLLSAIRHHQSWDYVYPVKNSACLLEATGEVVQRMVELLVSELGYETVIINFGGATAEMDKVIALCDTCFFLYSRGDVGIWREKQFVEEIERRGKEDVLNRIHRMEIPSISSGDGGWEKVADQWKWGSMGDGLRKLIREESALG